MRIGVIADTHGLLRPEAEERLAGVDHIIHAGDIGSPDIVPRLRAIAPTTAIRGNVDSQSWARAFPERQLMALAGRSVYRSDEPRAARLHRSPPVRRPRPTSSGR